MKTNLLCLIDPKLHPWEKASVTAILQALPGTVTQHCREFDSSDKKILGKAPDADVVWIATNRWYQNARFLGAGKTKAKVYISVFGPTPKFSLLSTFWRKGNPFLSGNTTLLAHSPMTYRFYREIYNLSSTQVKHMPLPVLHAVPKLEGRKGKALKEIVIGTFASFTQTKNLHYFLTVAHSLLRKNPDLKFKIFGTGPYFNHFENMIQDLGISGNVEILDAHDLSKIGDIDVFLYVPLQNRHFIYALAAASARLAVLTTEIPGIEQIVDAGESGFILPVHDTKQMVSKIETILSSEELRIEIGEKLHNSVDAQFSSSRVAADYENLFFEISQSVLSSAA